MKQHYVIIACAIILSFQAIASHGISPDKERENAVSMEMFALLMAVQTELPAEKVKAHWEALQRFVNKLSHKRERYRSEQVFVKRLFYQVHRKFLKRYDQHTNLLGLFEDGYYNCATGSALYALLLDAFALEFEIRETPYHIFLMVYTDQRQDSMLIESTAPQGLFTDAKDITRALQQYQQPAETERAQHDVFSGIAIQEQINLRQLAGLNYFNQAVYHYNQQQLDKALQYLDQASYLYPAERMDVFRAVIYQTAQRVYGLSTQRTK